ncbi:hypothetical protein ACNKHX_23940 [Shigella flexneri]
MKSEDAIKGKLNWQGRRAAEKSPAAPLQTGSHDELHHHHPHRSAVAGERFSGAVARGEAVEAAAGHGP